VKLAFTCGGQGCPGFVHWKDVLPTWVTKPAPPSPARYILLNAVKEDPVASAASVTSTVTGLGYTPNSTANSAS
jgi:hypothetical protein